MIWCTSLTNTLCMNDLVSIVYLNTLGMNDLMTHHVIHQNTHAL